MTSAAVHAALADVGGRIRATREDRGWSQEALGSRCGRTQTTISYWETGRRAMTIDSLMEVAEALGVPASTLLPDVTPPSLAAARLDHVEREVVARAVMVAAALHPRDVGRARDGLHRRMYVDAPTLVDLVDAIEQLYPGVTANTRATMAPVMGRGRKGGSVRPVG